MRTDQRQINKSNIPPSTLQLGIQRLTPQSLARPLPDIVAAFAPQAPSCSNWDLVNGWINSNPLIATAALVGLALFVIRK